MRVTDHERRGRRRAKAGAPAIAIAVLVFVGVLLPLPAAGADPLVTSRVSVDSTGAEANGDTFGPPRLSGDGRYVAFSSFATNLAEGDSNGAADVFVHRRSGDTVRVSVDSGGRQANGDSARPDLSADARFVAFSSAATNLVAGDTNNGRDVFVHDRQDGATTRVSVDSAATQANGESASPALSADARFVAFSSSATNLVSGDTNGAADVFVRDRESGVTTRVSVATTSLEPAQGDGPSENPAISGSGRFVAFQSSAANLVTGDGNGMADVFVHDRDADGDGVFDEGGLAVKTTLVSASIDGLARADGYSSDPAVNNEGRFVAFASFASNLTPPDGMVGGGVFVRDLQTGVTTKVGAGGLTPDISANGRFVAFAARTSGLVTGDTNSAQDVFKHDRDTDGDGLFDEIGAVATTRESVDSAGGQANGDSASPGLSGDARVVGFESSATNLVAGDTNAKRDVFARGPAPPAFSLTSSPTSQSVTAGQETSFSITVNRTGGFTAPVGLDVSGVPVGVSVSIFPNPTITSSTLAVTTASSATSGTYTLTVTGTSDGLTRTTTVTLVVNRTPDFSLSASPASQTVGRGQTASYTVTIAPSGGFSGAVGLSVRGQPAGSSASFSPNPATSSSTLSVGTARGTKPGTYTLTITGTSGALSRTTTATLVVRK